MRKPVAAKWITLAVAALVLATVAVRQTDWGRRSPATPGGQTPEDAIYAMLDAAREGDVDSYLDHYRGRIRAMLDQVLAEKGDGVFAEYLRQSNAPIKGIAITEPERLSPNEVKARVEFVYTDRNEVQFMHLENLDGRWRITSLEAARRVETPVPYGAPAN